MLDVKLRNGSQLVFTNPRIEGNLTITLERTLRIPDDGRNYPLPPSLGHFPIRRVADYADRVPKKWLETGGVFVPMYQREALWIAFQARHWRPNAVKVAAGRINAVSGKPWSKSLQREAQDYLVCPPQPWLDGFNTGQGTIRQFVAAPLGMGITVEGQVTGREEHGGLQIVVFEPKRGKFPKSMPRPAVYQPINYLQTRFGGDVLDKLVARRSLTHKRRARAKSLSMVIERGWVSETEVLGVLGEMLGVRVLEKSKINPEIARCAPEHLCRRYKCMPIDANLNTLLVAMVDPLNVLALDDLKLITGFAIEPVLASETQLTELLESTFGTGGLCEVEETVKDISCQDFGPLMGLGCGGSMTQDIYGDPHGFDTWSRKKLAEIHIHLVNSRGWTEITGEAPPPTTVDALAYTRNGYPWFEYYEAEATDIAPSAILSAVQPIPSQDPSVAVPLQQVLHIPAFAGK